MKIFWKWSHWNKVWVLTALLCCSEAICSLYSLISVVWDINWGKLESGSLIHLSTTLCFMAYQPEIFTKNISVTQKMCDGFCLLLSCCLSSQPLTHLCCHFPTNWRHFFSFLLPSLIHLSYKEPFLFGGLVHQNKYIAYVGKFPFVWIENDLAFLSSLSR